MIPAPVIRCLIVDFGKIVGNDLMNGAGIMTNRWSIEMLESFNETSDY